MKKAFTLFEILIILSLTAILATAAIFLINPSKQFQKARNTQRKKDLAELRKVLEDFYGDNNRYPKASEICYNSPSSSRIDQYGKTACFCNLCGSNPTSPKYLSSYLSSLPCDPQSNKVEYLYDFDCKNPNSPQWYRIYTKFSNSNKISLESAEPETITLRCYYNGCGPKPLNYGYSYGINSSNIDLERSDKYTFCTPSGCNACSDGTNPTACFNNPPSAFCQNIIRIYDSSETCSQQCPCQP
jgi:type II secretory pathway pseudopilin PulG